jgi:hypothetical protein
MKNPNSGISRLIKETKKLNGEVEINEEVEIKNDMPEPSNEFVNLKNEETGELYGQKGPEPTRYGDWEKNGRISDF